jgi:hypothetical protein
VKTKWGTTAVRWHAPCAAVCLRRTQRPTPKDHDPWAQAPVPKTRSPWRASGEVFCGASGRQWENPSLKRDSPKRGSHSHQRPFALELSVFLCRCSRHGLARPSRALLAQGGTQLGAQPARMGCASVCWEDLCWCLSSRRPRRRRVCVLCFQTPQRVGSADPVFPRAVAGGAWPLASTRGVLLHPSGSHHRLPPWDVHGGDAPSRFFLQQAFRGGG